jgi:hypothetical protein
MSSNFVCDLLPVRCDELYAKGDYWTSGSWTKEIQIADLDSPATLRLNQKRGVKSALPAGPDEVVMR